MLYFLTVAGVLVVVVGTYYTLTAIRKQENSEFDKRSPQSAIERPVTRNPSLWTYFVIPIATAILGIIAWLVYEYG